jgi:glycine cleavage system protein P-like pyridoxal-binding family
VCLRREKTLRFNSYFRKHYLHKLAEEKLTREMDITRVMRNMRKNRIGINMAFNPLEQMIMKFQKRNLIKTSESENAEEYHNYGALLDTSNSCMLRLGAVSKLKAVLTTLE